jgi:NADH:ubiquinone oxidoreductase subunit 3 (subunit A)
MSDGIDLVIGMMLFIVGGIDFTNGLTIGKLVRTRLPHPEKAAYECGEPAIGTSWVFDLRFYVVLFVPDFDIEIACSIRGRSSSKESGIAALWDMLFFFSVIVVGYLYLWNSDTSTGSLRRTAATCNSVDALSRARRWS